MQQQEQQQSKYFKKAKLNQKQKQMQQNNKQLKQKQQKQDNNKQQSRKLWLKNKILEALSTKKLSTEDKGKDMLKKLRDHGERKWKLNFHAYYDSQEEYNYILNEQIITTLRKFWLMQLIRTLQIAGISDYETLSKEVEEMVFEKINNTKTKNMIVYIKRMKKKIDIAHKKYPYLFDNKFRQEFQRQQQQQQQEQQQQQSQSQQQQQEQQRIDPYSMKYSRNMENKLELFEKGYHFRR